MRARFGFLLLLLCIAVTFIGAAAGAQEHSSAAVAPAAHGAQPIVLGPSAEPLELWKFHPGDDPAYAQPGYDDSGWKSMSLEAPESSHDPYFSGGSYVPGWTGRGYPNLTGFAWYRTSIRINGPQNDLWMEMPTDVDDAYQVYANGQLLGSMGEFNAHKVTPFYSHPMEFHIPAVGTNGDVVLALRFYMQPESVLWNFEAGGMHGAPVIGLAQTVALLQRQNENAVLNTALSYPLLGLLALIAFTAALWIYFIDHSEPAYLWLAMAFATQATLYFCTFLTSITYWITYSAMVLIHDVIGSALGPLFWLLFWAHWFRLPRMRLVGRTAWALALLELCTFACLRQPIMGSLISLSWTHDLWLLSTLLRLGFAFLLVAITVGGIRTNRAEGWVALPAVVLLGITLFSSELEVLGEPVSYFPFGIRLGVEDISLFVLILVVLSLVIRRFLRSQVRQQEMTHDLEQAQEIQSLLVQEQFPETPGYRIEGTYLPASQVGGDFYQVLPLPDGSLIAVLGDVSGKGLRAAMVVSMVVGAVRAIVHETWQPEEILERLNRELTGSLKSGFATCICARLHSDGTVTIANAGHLPPWVNKNEIVMQGTLPLGLMASAEYEAVNFHLDRGDTLMVMSDGVVEARRENGGELYGFDRLATLVATGPTAEAIAMEAQRFGQEDDISVLSIRRLAIAVSPVATIGNLVTT